MVQVCKTMARRGPGLGLSRIDRIGIISTSYFDWCFKHCLEDCQNRGLLSVSGNLRIGHHNGNGSAGRKG